jgi:hypothetical protein
MVAGNEDGVEICQHLKAGKRFGTVTDRVAQAPDRRYSQVAEISLDSFEGRKVGVNISKHGYSHNFYIA